MEERQFDLYQRAISEIHDPSNPFLESDFIRDEVSFQRNLKKWRRMAQQADLGLKLDGVSRANWQAIGPLVEKKWEKWAHDSGRIHYERTEDATGHTQFVPHGDSRAFIDRHEANGFKGRFAELKFIDGKPRLVSSLKKIIIYE